MRKLLDETNESRQTVLFSATLDGAVAVLTREYQNNPARHEVGAAEPDITLAEHRFWKVEPGDRVERTADIISANGPTIVFCRTRHGVDRVVKVLSRTGVHAAAIHGGRSQGQRDRALRAFKDGHASALVATDVAARGIHVDDVACVVHFDLPADAKDYLHRSGRTARAGASGIVVSLVAEHQTRDAKRLQRAAGITGDVQHPPPDASASSVRCSPSRPRTHEPQRSAARTVAAARRPEARVARRQRPQRRRPQQPPTAARSNRRTRSGTTSLRGDRERLGLGAPARHAAAEVADALDAFHERVACTSASGVRPSSASTFQCRNTTGTRICS